jgi:hypothetical protein
VNSLQTEILRTHEEVKSGSPGARERLHELQRQYREGRHLIERVGGSCQLIDRGASPKAARISTPGPKRPSWQLGDKEELSYRDVELREHFVSYKVRLTHSIGRDSTLATEMSMRWHLAL